MGSKSSLSAPVGSYSPDVIPVDASVHQIFFECGPPSNNTWSSNPLMMDYEGGDLLAGWRCLCAGYRVTHCLCCVCRLGGDLNSGLAAQFQ